MFSIDTETSKYTSHPVTKASETFQAGHIYANMISLAKAKTDIEDHGLTLTLLILQGDLSSATQSELTRAVLTEDLKLKGVTCSVTGCCAAEDHAPPGDLPTICEFMASVSKDHLTTRLDISICCSFTAT